MTTKKYEVPRTNLVPVNGRIFCSKILRVEQIGKAGIIKPVTYKKNDDNGNPTIEVAYNRFFVIVVAADVNIRVPDGDGGTRRLQYGDEILPMENPDAIGWVLPIINDFENDRQDYYVLHESEISGYNPEPGDIIVEKDNDETKGPGE